MYRSLIPLCSHYERSLRYIAAHLLAKILLESSANGSIQKVGIDSTGFFVEFATAHQLSKEHLCNYEERMRRLLQEDKTPIRTVQMVPMSARAVLKKQRLPRTPLDNTESNLVYLIQIGSYLNLVEEDLLACHGEITKLELNGCDKTEDGIRLFGRVLGKKSAMVKLPPLQKQQEYLSLKALFDSGLLFPSCPTVIPQKGVMQIDQIEQTARQLYSCDLESIRSRGASDPVSSHQEILNTPRGSKKTIVQTYYADEPTEFFPFSQMLLVSSIGQIPFTQERQEKFAEELGIPIQFLKWGKQGFEIDGPSHIDPSEIDLKNLLHLAPQGILGFYTDLLGRSIPLMFTILKPSPSGKILHEALIIDAPTHLFLATYEKSLPKKS